MSLQIRMAIPFDNSYNASSHLKNNGMSSNWYDFNSPKNSHHNAAANPHSLLRHPSSQSKNGLRPLEMGVSYGQPPSLLSPIYDHPHSRQHFPFSDNEISPQMTSISLGGTAHHHPFSHSTHSMRGGMSSRNSSSLSYHPHHQMPGHHHHFHQTRTSSTHFHLHQAPSSPESDGGGGYRPRRMRTSSMSSSRSSGSVSTPKHPQLYKTTICDVWARGDGSVCRFGEKCWFAHGPGELRNAADNNKDFSPASMASPTRAMQEWMLLSQHNRNNSLGTESLHHEQQHAIHQHLGNKIPSSNRFARDAVTAQLRAGVEARIGKSEMTSSPGGNQVSSCSASLTSSLSLSVSHSRSSLFHPNNESLEEEDETGEDSSYSGEVVPPLPQLSVDMISSVIDAVDNMPQANHELSSAHSSSSSLLSDNLSSLLSLLPPSSAWSGSESSISFDSSDIFLGIGSLSSPTDSPQMTSSSRDSPLAEGSSISLLDEICDLFASTGVCILGASCCFDHRMRD